MATALPPSRVTLAAFGITSADQDDILNLPGGRGMTWRAGGTVLRPSAGDGETLWKANVLAELPHSAGFRTPRPIAARSGEWTVDGWEAWQWLPGAADETRVTDVLDAGEAFHHAVRVLDRPHFLDQADDPWARSDRIAWQEESPPANATLHRLIAAFHPVSATAQIIRIAEARNVGRQFLIRALAFRVATFELLGLWDDRMQSQHAPVIEAAFV